MLLLALRYRRPLKVLRIAVDTGGTFTDAVADDGRVVKVPSTPADPSQAVAAACAQLGADANTEVIHGTTVGTNALLTRALPPTGAICNSGFEHLLLIGRQSRPELYALAPRKPWLPLTASLCAGVPGRLDHMGYEIEAFDAAACRRAGRGLVERGAQAIAVVLLHSWHNPAHEQAALQALLPLGVPVTVSSALQREFREVERGIAALLNAALRPVVGPYISALQRRLPQDALLRIMTSAGGTIASAVAAEQPVRLLLSGPAGGVVAAAALARTHRLGAVLSLDMGGTSADVAWCEGAVPHVPELRIAGVSVRTPSLAIHTVGAGGGSIAALDAGGALRVGPESAGSDPGPACHGNDGPFTVTDAHLLLGNLAPEFFPAGADSLDRAAAELALRALAKCARLSPLACARGVITLANASMARALRFMGEEQGRDPRQATLLPFGGAGGLHVSALARSLGVRRFLLPAAAGAFSAQGLLLAPLAATRSRTLLGALVARGARPGRTIARNSGQRLAPPPAKFVRELRDEAIAELLDAGASRRQVQVSVSCDLRYEGQSFEIEVPLCADLARAFHKVHQQRAGFADPTRRVELVGVRVRAEAAVPTPTALVLPPARGRKAQAVGRTRTAFGTGLPVFDRDLLLRGQKVCGPALLCDHTATALLAAGDEGVVLADGAILVQRGGAA